MHHQFEQGVALGQLIERQRSTDKAVDGLRIEVREVKTEVSHIRTALQRAGLLVALYGAAIGLAVTNEQTAAAVATIIRAVMGRG